MDLYFRSISHSCKKFKFLNKCYLCNLGSILSPLVYEYLPNWLFFSIFALISIFHSVLIYFLPETVGKQMVETIEELVNK